MIQQQANNRQRQLQEQLNILEQRYQEINNEVKKRKSKQPANQDRQQRLRILSSHIDQLRVLSDNLTALNIDVCYLVIQEQQWSNFMSLLDTLYQNLDNPEHEQELKQVLEYLNKLIGSFQQIKINQIPMPDKQSQPIKTTIEAFDSQAASKQAQLVDQNTLAYKLRMMELSFNDRPQGNDYYQPPTFKEKLNLKSLLPKYKMLPHSIFNQLGSDTLFYMFYYHKEPTEQNMAARELIKNQWIFNSKHGIWMKKDKHFNYKEGETDKVIKGPFFYFDYEQKWQQKKKSDFSFKKKYILQQELFQ